MRFLCKSFLFLNVNWVVNIWLTINNWQTYPRINAVAQTTKANITTFLNSVNQPNDISTKIENKQSKKDIFRIFHKIKNRYHIRHRKHEKSESLISWIRWNENGCGYNSWQSYSKLPDILFGYFHLDEVKSFRK